MEFDSRRFDDAGPEDFGLKPWALDLSGAEWNARMTAEGLLNCLKAEETAKGLLRTNDIVVIMDLVWTWRLEEEMEGKVEGIQELRWLATASMESAGNRPTGSHFRSPGFSFTSLLP